MTTRMTKLSENLEKVNEEIHKIAAHDICQGTVMDLAHLVLAKEGIECAIEHESAKATKNGKTSEVHHGSVRM